MRLGLLLLGLALAACAPDTRDALTGCWEGGLGDEHVTYRFDPDGHSVSERDLVRGRTYSGDYALAGDRLMLNFGEDPPTYTIELTATALRFVELATTYARVDCVQIVE